MGYINLKDPKPTLLLTDWVPGYLDSLPSLWILGFFILGFFSNYVPVFPEQCGRPGVTVISLTWSGLLGSEGGGGLIFAKEV